jgi:hypothetical protein
VLFQRTLARAWLTRVIPYMRSVLVAVSMWQWTVRRIPTRKSCPISNCPVCASARRRKEKLRLEEDEAAADAEGYGFGARGGAEFA